MCATVDAIYGFLPQYDFLHETGHNKKIEGELNRAIGASVNMVRRVFPLDQFALMCPNWRQLLQHMTCVTLGKRFTDEWREKAHYNPHTKRFESGYNLRDYDLVSLLFPPSRNIDTFPGARTWDFHTDLPCKHNVAPQVVDGNTDDLVLNADPGCTCVVAPMGAGKTFNFVWLIVCLLMASMGFSNTLFSPHDSMVPSVVKKGLLIIPGSRLAEKVLRMIEKRCHADDVLSITGGVSVFWRGLVHAKRTAGPRIGEWFSDPRYDYTDLTNK